MFYRVLLLVALAACTPRGELGFTQAAAPGRSIFVGTTRAFDANGDPTLFERAETLGLARYDVAIPPEHLPGEITYPKGEVDPQTDFAVTGKRNYTDDPAFRGDLARQLARNGGEAVVFVHGYNTNFAEGLYRLAQLGQDFEVPGVLVSYSWPSRGTVAGYAYDRDSALFARDGLESLLKELRLAGARRINIIAHSMGSSVTMETLRQMAIAGDRATLDRLSGVILISPDLDVDVFRNLATRMGKLPEPFVIFTSQKDKALQLSGWISGEPARLGNLQDVSELADLKVTLVDVGAFNTGEGHFNVGNSPALIALMNRAGAAEALVASDGSPSGLLPMVVLSVRNVTQIVLRPVIQ
ncbi:alpha/beta fold hydrolase [Rhodobacter sp. KR11]|jgi:esterase/lipase superfamily enzyme|uniref:alpha/beta hydrolase n=1 Tax=Rhodobacter sp. KR11 TaxID=2974588 RepID=UPI002221D8CA|nr:alpha/beta fold hydrolase [Rhodobacter sp. KR11]MCW1918888.1 alpha/beta fold hydrolase [Rhodobacter sp. KR11]